MKDSRRSRAGGKTLLVAFLGIFLYGFTSWLGNIFPLEASENIEIRLGVAVPIFFGFAYGPLVGFLTGTLGNFLSDLWSGWIVYPPHGATGQILRDVAAGFLLHWQLGNGLMGLIPGIAARLRPRFYTWADQGFALLATVAGVAVGMGVASLLAIPLDGRSWSFAWSQLFLPAVQVNVLSAAVSVPVLLYNYARLDLKPTQWLQSGLMRQLLVTLLISAALPVVLLGLLLLEHTAGTDADMGELAMKVVLTLLLSLGFTIVNAALMAQNISRPLLRLTEAARLMERNSLTGEQATALEQQVDPKAPPEIARLATVFGRMAREVIQRETALRRQVKELRIQIDQSQQHRQVSEITESQFFQTLASRAHHLRRRRQERAAGLDRGTGESPERMPG